MKRGVASALVGPLVHASDSDRRKLNSVKRMIRLGIFTTHPIQYQVPLFRALGDLHNVNITVYYDHLPNPVQQGRGFSRPITWDLPLLKGYRWSVRKSSSLAPEYRFTLVRALKQNDIALITGWQPSYLLRARILAFILRRPVIIRGESSSLKPRPLYARVIHKSLLALPSQLLTIGRANAQFYMHQGVTKHRLHASPYFVDNARFNSDYLRLSRERVQIRSKYNISVDAVCFLFAGKFIEKKRPLDVLHALINLVDLRGRIHLLMVGSGVLLPRARALAERNRLPVTFTGFLNQTEIAAAYTAADALILPSDYDETWGLVVNECMIFQNPAIVSDRVGCGPDLVEDGCTGYSFPFGDTIELANAMRRLTLVPSERAKMGRRAREKVLRDYSVDKAVEGVCKAVRAVLENSKNFCE